MATIKARSSITVSKERDIDASWRFYRIASSTSTPSAPTEAQGKAFVTNHSSVPSGWSLTEPGYDGTTTNSLYYCDLTSFTDGEVSWSAVSKSSSYEAAKQAYNQAAAALEAATPIEEKTYTGLIGSANDAANASFYFAKIHPTNYTVQWKVSLRIRVTAPEAYQQSVTIQFGGYGSTFSSYDSYTVRNASLGMYYVNLYRATAAGINTNHKGHALGIGLRSSTNPANASYARTVSVELLEVENCTVDMQDAAVKYAAIDGTGSTNYTGLTEMGVASAGQNATNNSNTSYTQYGNAVKAGSVGVKRYTLLMRDTEDTWVSFVDQANSVATTKTVSTIGMMPGKLLYSSAGAEYASGANTGAVWDVYPFDLRYSTNCGTTLTAYKPVYLVGTLDGEGLFYLNTTAWWTQTIPTAEDGKTYIYIGMAYSTYQVWLATENDAYQYYEGAFRTLSEIEEMKAAKTATNYLSYDVNYGLMIADMVSGEYTPGSVRSGVRNVLIDSDSVDIRNGTDVLASFGEEVWIGHTDGDIDSFIKISKTSFSMYGNEEYLRVGTISDENDECICTYTYTATGQESTYAGGIDGTSALIGGGNYAEESLITLDTVREVYVDGVLQNQSSYYHGQGCGGVILKPKLTSGQVLFIKYTPYQNIAPYFIYGTRDEDYGIGLYSSSFGIDNVASGKHSVSFGENTKALGRDASSFGTRTTAGGYASAAFGMDTVASGNEQFVIGRKNVPDLYNQAFIIGNGNALEGPSNALSVDWNGQIIRKTHEYTENDIGTLASNIYKDANDNQIGYDQIAKNSSGNMYRSFVVQRRINNVSYSNAMYLGIKDDGSYYVTLNQQAAWLEALDLGVLSNKHNYYGASTTGTKTFTLVSGCVYLISIGNVNASNGSGLYLACVHGTTSNLITIAAITSAVGTISLTKTTLTITTAKNYVTIGITRLS